MEIVWLIYCWLHTLIIYLFFAPSACGIIIFGIVAGLRVKNAQQENARQPFL